MIKRIVKNEEGEVIRTEILNENFKPVEIKISEGFKLLFEYDDKGNKTCGYDSVHHGRCVYENIYDDKNRLIKSKKSFGSEVSYEYKYEYDEQGKLIKCKESTGYEETYEYNDKDLLYKTTDTLGSIEICEYDDQNRLIKIVITNKDDYTEVQLCEYEDIKE